MKRLWKKMTFPVEALVRSQQIGVIVSASGVAGAFATLGFEVGKRGLVWVGASSSHAVRFDAVFGKNLARTFALLGPTFIKLGQILASRPELVGEPVADELRVLFDRVPSIPFRQIEKILRKELGKETLKIRFQSIDPKPLASASLSQTHKAQLSDGTPVILKIQKRGVAKLVKLDLFLMAGLARPLHFARPRLGIWEGFEEFRLATLREIDYREEAKNIDQFHKNYRRFFTQSNVLFPGYIKDLTTRRLLVLEPMRGKGIGTLRKGSTVARRAAATSLEAILEQIFDHGFFHADPHAGNLFYLEDEGRIGFIDLGLVGQLDVMDKRKFLKVLMAVLQRDREKLAKCLFNLGTPSKTTNYEDFEKAIQALLDAVKAKGVNNIKIDRLIQDLFAIARKNGVNIPNRYLLMARSCLIIEGVAKSLDPNISLFTVAVPIVAKSLMKTYNPFYLFRR